MTSARIMGDSTNYLAIPADVQIAAFYDDGLYSVAAADVEKRFPSAKYGWCRIDVSGGAPQAQVRDWETGDKSGSLEQWVIDHNEASGKKDAVVYCDRSTIGQVRAGTGSQVLGADYHLWVSTLDGTVVTAGPEHLGSAPYTYPGVIACQVKGAQLTGGDWDMSLVYDGTLWLPVAPRPVLVSQAAAKAAVTDAMARLVTAAVYFAEG
jgi:hypothetical protein